VVPQKGLTNALPNISSYIGFMVATLIITGQPINTDFINVILVCFKSNGRISPLLFSSELFLHHYFNRKSRS
jgi:hypothetical protein